MRNTTLFGRILNSNLWQSRDRAAKKAGKSRGNRKLMMESLENRIVFASVFGGTVTTGVSGLVLNDLNANGIRDSREKGLGRLEYLPRSQ
jgi:hypothetical protein